MSDRMTGRNMRAGSQKEGIGEGLGRATERLGGAMAQALQRSAGMTGDPAGRSADMMSATARGGALMGPGAGHAVMGVAVATGRAWLNLMMGMQRASLESLLVYSPSQDARIEAGDRSSMCCAEDTVVGVGEERLNVGARTVIGGTTRIRRRVVEQPVEQEVTLRDECVVVERRALSPGEAAAVPRAGVLTETVVEMSDSRQVPQVWKSVHVAEEVFLRRQVTERREQVREVLRRDVVEVEHDGEVQRAGPGEAAGGPEAPNARDAAKLGGAGHGSRTEEPESAAQRSEALAEAARQATNAGAAQVRQHAEEAPAKGRPREQDHAEVARRGAELTAEATRRGAEASADAVRRGAEASVDALRRGPESAETARRMSEEQERGRGQAPSGPGQPPGGAPSPQRRS